MSTKNLWLFLCLLFLVNAATVFPGGRKEFDSEAIWPGWRGPESNGISKETDWNPKNLNGDADIAWTTNVGAGFSSVSIADGQVYTIGHKNRRDTVFCLNAENGSIVWEHSYDAAPGQYPGPRATPAIYEDRLYVLAQSGMLYCLEREGGTTVWKRDLVDEFGAVSPEWGFAGSPVIRDGTIYLNVGLAGMALKSDDGSLVWKTGDVPCGYASPVFIEVAGVTQVVMFGASGLYGVNADSGTILWEYDWQTGYDVNAADPLVIGNRIFISSGYRRGCVLVEIGENGVETVWESSAFNSHFSSFVYAEGYIYGNDGDANAHRGAFKCLDASNGEIMWEYRDGLGSLMIAGEYLLTVTERRRLAVVELTASEYSEVASCTLPKGLIWSPPVLAGGFVFIRGMNGELYALRA